MLCACHASTLAGLPLSQPRSGRMNFCGVTKTMERLWGRLPHLAKWRIEVDVPVVFILNDKIKGCVSGSLGRDCSLDEGMAIPVAEVVSLSQWFELLIHFTEEIIAAGLEVDTQAEGLLRISSNTPLPVTLLNSF